jgi:hypothetical protein
MDEKGVIKTTLTEYEAEKLELLKSAFDMGCALKMLALQKESRDWELKYLNEKKDWEEAQGQIGRFIVQVELLKGELARAKTETAREICKELFEKQTEVYNNYVFKNEDYDDLETNAIINFSDSLSYAFEKYFEEKYGVDLGESKNG